MSVCVKQIYSKTYAQRTLTLSSTQGDVLNAETCFIGSGLSSNVAFSNFRVHCWRTERADVDSALSPFQLVGDSHLHLNMVFASAWFKFIDYSWHSLVNTYQMLNSCGKRKRGFGDG